MRVLVDARAVASGRGVGRYAQRMLEAAVALPAPGGAPASDWHAVLPGRGRGTASLPAAVTVHRPRLSSRMLFGLAAATGRPRLEDLGGPADVVWLPAVAPVAIGPATPLVVTLHDLSYQRRPADFTRYERAWHRAARIDRLLHRATAIVCDTEAVAAELALASPPLAAAVRVVAPGVDRPPAGPAPALPPGLPGRYLLVVGALEPRKAPALIAAGFAAARAGGLQADLVVAGEGRLAAALTGPGVHCLGRVDDATLHALYANARALVMPSWLEGFGLPPLEAALHGTPAVVTDLPVFRETIGDGALRIPPGDVAALAAALLAIDGDDALHAHLAAAGAARAAALTWERAARALCGVLTEAAVGSVR